MTRLKNRTTARYFEKGKYVKDGLNCWTKSGADFECKVECPYNERKAECDCHTAVSKDALDYINELEAKLADVVPKSEVERLESEVAILNEKNAGLALACFCDCMANDDCLGHNEWKAIKAKIAREIFEAIEKHRDKIHGIVLLFPEEIAELKKKYTEVNDDKTDNHT